MLPWAGVASCIVSEMGFAAVPGDGGRPMLVPFRDVVSVSQRFAVAGPAPRPAAAGPAVAPAIGRSTIGLCILIAMSEGTPLPA